MKKTDFNTLIRLIAVCLAFSYSSSGICNIYKWVDDQGNVHYGQQQPANATSEKMDIQRHAPQDTSTYKRPSLNKQDPQAEEKNADEAEANDEEKKQPKTAAEKKKHNEACAQARQQLSTMQSIGRIRSKDKDGNISYLSQPQKEARMKQLRDLISRQCK